MAMRFSFTLGSGCALITLLWFLGTIELVRPGCSRGARDRDHDRDPDRVTR
jgi:hypothetical protein